jgi:hypothetical protein
MSLSISFSRKESRSALYASLVAFLTYATVYGFRKTFTVATFDGQSYLGLGFKELLVIMQAIGYMSSKFFGIGFISELQKIGRWKVILLLVSIAWLSWLGFATIPAPYNIVFLFLNGFPLGLLWGVIFSYVEGRKTTDFIGSAMAVSFIFSSGFVKSIGYLLLSSFNVSEQWMPFVAGAIFFPLLVFFVFQLEKIPPPTEGDIQSRINRVPMSRSERRSIIVKYLPGIILMISVYMILTIFRDVRDNFIADIFKELGYSGQPELFTQTEAPIALAVLVLTGALILVKKNLKALNIIHFIIVAGFFIAGVFTYLYLNHQLNPVVWITMVGLGLYMGYIPFNCVLFERFIAAFKISGNVGFLMYLADSFGYLGSVSVILFKSVMNRLNISFAWSEYYSISVMIMSVIGIAAAIVSAYYLNRKYKLNSHE